MHRHELEGIFPGVLKFMSWEPYATRDDSMKLFGHYLIQLPELDEISWAMEE